MSFSWQGVKYDLGQYQRIDSPVDPPTPPTLTKEQYDKLSRPVKMEYDALQRVYKTWQARKAAMARQQQAKQRTSSGGLRQKLGDAPKNLFGVKVTNDEGRVLAQKDFNLMRGGLMALHRTTEDLFSRVEELVKGTAIDPKTKKPVKLDNEDKLKTEMLYRLIQENLKISTKFSEGRGGLSSDQLTKMIEGFEQIDDLAEKLDKELVSVTQINEFFKRNRINEVVDRNERNKMATVLTQIKDVVGADVKRIAKVDPNKLAKTTGGLSTLATTALSSFLGPVGDLVGLVANTEKVSEYIESKGAALWNKIRGKYNLKGERVAGRLSKGEKDVTAAGGVPGQTTQGQQTPATPTPDPSVAPPPPTKTEQETSDKVKTIADDVEDIVDQLSDDEVDAALEDFNEGVVDSIQKGIEELGDKATEALAEMGVEGIEQAVRTQLRPLLDTGHPMGEEMVKDIMDVLTEPLNEQTERLEAKLEEVKVEVVKAVEVPRTDQARMGISVRDEQDLAERNEKERRSFEEDQQVKNQGFFVKQFDRLVKSLRKVEQEAGEGGGGLLQTIAAGLGLKGLLGGGKGRGGRGGRGGLGGKIPKGRLGRLGSWLRRLPKGKRGPAGLALTAAALAGSMFVGDEDEEASALPANLMPLNINRGGSLDESPKADMLIQQQQKALDESREATADTTAAAVGAVSLLGKWAPFISGAASRIATPLYAGVEGYHTYNEVKDDDTISAQDKVGQVAGSTGGAVAGGILGAKLLGGIGLALGGPIGAGIGAFLGGIGGALAGSSGGRWLGSKIGQGFDVASQWSSNLVQSDSEMLATSQANRTPTRAELAKMEANGINTGSQFLLPRDENGKPITPAATTTASPVSPAKTAPEGSSPETKAAPTGGAPLPSDNNIVAIGKSLQQQGYRVDENPAFGGVTPGVHKGAGHKDGRAIDINTRDGQSKEEMAELDALAKQLMPLVQAGKLRMIWRQAGHFNHMHLEVPKGMEKDQDLMQALVDNGIVKADSNMMVAGKEGEGGPAMSGSAVANAEPSEFGRGEMPNYSPNVNVPAPQVNVAQAPTNRGPKAQTPGLREATFMVDDIGLVVMGSGVV